MLKYACRIPDKNESRVGKDGHMSRKKKPVRASRPSLFGRMLSLEIKGYIKPFFIAAAVYIVALIAAALSVKLFPAAKTATYAVLYVSMLALFAVTATVAIRRAYLDIAKNPLFDKPKPTPAELTGAKLLALFIFTLASALLHAAADATVTLLGELTHVGYAKTLSSVSLLLFSSVFYLTAVIITSVSDYRPDPKKKPKQRRRRVIMDGVLLYALGLCVLMFVMLCFSAVPLGGETIEDITGITSGEITEGETILNPDIALPLSLMYLFACALRMTYLFFILKRRLCRAHKLA